MARLPSGTDGRLRGRFSVRVLSRGGVGEQKASSRESACVVERRRFLLRPSAGNSQGLQILFGEPFARFARLLFEPVPEKVLECFTMSAGNSEVVERTSRPWSKLYVGQPIGEFVPQAKCAAQPVLCDSMPAANTRCGSGIGQAAGEARIVLGERQESNQIAEIPEARCCPEVSFQLLLLGANLNSFPENL